MDNAFDKNIQKNPVEQAQSTKKYKKIPHHETVVRIFGSYFRPKRLLKRSTRPPVSTSFCLPV